MRSVFNPQSVDYTKQPMFFGEALNLQRYDVFRYPVFDKLNQTMLGQFWRPEEISLQKDRSDYLLFRPEQKFIFTKNLSYQILLDSVQGRAPATVLQQICSNPELEGCLITWNFFEAIHSRAYTHIIKNLYPNPAEIFDSVMQDSQIIKRAGSVTKHYDALHEAIQRYYLLGEGSLYELKKQLYRTVISINALEGIRFYLSFATTFAFAENKQVEGSAKNISLIARDEGQHLAIGQHIIKNWQKGDDEEMQEIMPTMKDEVIEIYAQVIDEEKEWAKYLFSEGSIIGLNEKLGCDYIEYMAGRRLKALNVETHPFTKIKNNPLPWTQHWLSSSGVQVAPQESEVESYLVGSINANVDISKFSKFEL